jgi:hypothetical protein
MPSKDLGKVWLEKIFLIKKTAVENPFDSSWFAWYDAGLCLYRNKRIDSLIWPNPTIFQFLPRDKILYTDSNQNEHSFAGTAYMIHKSIIKHVIQLFKKEIQLCEKDLQEGKLAKAEYSCGSDQIIWSRIKNTWGSTLFHNVGDGYGTLIPLIGFGAS